MNISMYNRKCPKCGLATQVVSTELLCSSCGVIDFSEERLKEAKMADFKVRFRSAIFLFAVIISVMVFVRTHPGFYRSYSSSVDVIFFYSILVTALCVNFYASWTTKKKFPEVRIE